MKPRLCAITLSAAVSAATLLPLGGCTTYVATRVTAFQNWNDGDTDRSYAFERTAEQANSLEQATYEGWVAQSLAEHGFTRAATARAHYLVALAYGAHSEVGVTNQPVYYDAWPGPFSPWWGPPMLLPAYVPQPYSVTVYSLQVRILEHGTGHEVYRVSASSEGGDASLVRAMPYLVRSAFTGFPLNNGTVTEVRLPYAPAAAGARQRGP